MMVNVNTLIFLARGLGTTILIAFSTIVLSFVFGSVLGILRFSSKGLPGKLATLYVDVIRNIPLLLFIIGFRFTLPLPPLASAVAAMTVFTTAMVAEIIRGGLAAIPAGQWEAAYSQGFSFIGTMLYVILPQALKKMIRPLMGQFVTTIKDTSFCQIIAVKELMYSGMIVMGKFVSSVQIIMMYIGIAIVYYIVNILVLKISEIITRRR